MVQFKPPPLCNQTLSNSVNFSLDLKLTTDFIIYPLAQIERMAPCRCQVWFFALQNNKTQKVHWKIPHHELNLGSDDTKTPVRYDSHMILCRAKRKCIRGYRGACMHSRRRRCILQLIAVTLKECRQVSPCLHSPQMKIHIQSNCIFVQ